MFYYKFKKTSRAGFKLIVGPNTIFSREDPIAGGWNRHSFKLFKLQNKGATTHYNVPIIEGQGFFLMKQSMEQTYLDRKQFVHSKLVRG